MIGLNEALVYVPGEGKFFWNVARGKSKIGKEAGCLEKHGYVIITFKSKCYKAHRLAWYFSYGEFPPSDLDHINGNKSDNRISNLRLTNATDNSLNVVKAQANNKNGFLGVSKHSGKTKKPWQARVQVKGKRIHCGHYETPEEAYQAYLNEKAKQTNVHRTRES